MSTLESETVCREETVLRDMGFALIQSRDGRYVATETLPRAVPATLPHATPQEAWEATYKRVIRRN